jgi:lactate permease
MNIPTLISILPFVIFVYLLVWRRVTLLKTSFLTAGLFALIGIIYFKMQPALVALSFGKGALVAFDILIIVFGAIYFLETLEHLGVIKNISYYLETFSKDYRIQVIMLAWFFESFLEGTAGFGTPAAVVVPLLIGMGFGPIRALVLGLLGNSVAGAFGAAGTPIRVGFAGLNTASVPLLASVLNLAGAVVPIFMLWVATRGREKAKEEFMDALPFAIWSGIAFTGASILSVPLGQEFPSIIGAVIGLLLVMATSRMGLFMPKEIKKFDDERVPERTMNAGRAFFPYAILVALLVAGKFLLGNANLSFEIGSLRHTFSWFNPGFAFIAAALITTLVSKKEFIERKEVKDAFKSAVGPFMVIVAVTALAQIMINSGTNASGLPSITKILSQIFGVSLLPFFAPFVSAFGSFITGSATVSNIMFGNFFAAVSMELGLNLQLILSLGLTGAAAGNMIALADIMAAEVVVKIRNKEVEIIKGVFIPCLTYLIILGVVGLLLA